MYKRIWIKQKKENAGDAGFMNSLIKDRMKALIS